MAMADMMSVASTTTSVVPANLAAQLRRSQRRKKAFAISLTLPLLIFLLATFIVPISALLVRAVENPEVASTLGHTVQVLKTWDRIRPTPHWPRTWRPSPNNRMPVAWRAD